MDLSALFTFTYGMYIVTAADGDKANAQIANTVFQITSDPAVMAISINKGNYTHELISKSGKFNICVLSTDADFKFIGNFGFKSGRDHNKFTGIQTKQGENGVPIVLDNCLAAIECELTGQTDYGTHTVFSGKIIAAETIAKGEPMTYDYYHKVIKGKSPKAAPTYVAPPTQV